MRAVTSVAAASTGIAIVALACAPRLPAPPYAAQPTSALSEIPYPPPPARAESVPPKPRVDGAVWIDGEWLWRARRWSWRPGRWIVPPAGARFSPWATARDRAGTLFIAPGTWRDGAGAVVLEPPPLAIGVPGGGAIVSPEGAKVEQGPIAPLDAGAAGDTALAPAGDRARMADAGPEEP